jgi:hypothetical protein
MVPGTPPVVDLRRSFPAFHVRRGRICDPRLMAGAANGIKFNADGVRLGVAPGVRALHG